MRLLLMKRFILKNKNLCLIMEVSILHLHNFKRLQTMMKIN